MDIIPVRESEREEEKEHSLTGTRGDTTTKAAVEGIPQP